MRILNYGAGAVGLGVDSFLLKAGAAVDILAREKTVKALKADGLYLTGLLGDYHAPAKNLRAFTSLDQVDGIQYDFILVSTKSFDSQQSAQDISRHPKLLKPTTKIILFQNGWGNAEIFASYFDKNQIFNARVITGFNRPRPNQVAVTVHADSVRMGSLFQTNISSIKEVSQAITLGGFPCEITEEIDKFLWSKMLYNCALNPLGAILDVSYRTLGEYTHTREIMDEVIREVYQIMMKADYQTHWPTPEEYLEKFYKEFLPATAEHFSSTLQDLKAKKRTEIDALNGAVVRLADHHQLNVPVNRFLFRMIRFIEEKNLKSAVAA